MTNEFKVMPWLRKIREEHARQQVGLTDRERIEQDRKAADDIRDILFKRRRRESDIPAIRVAEPPAKYGGGETH
jgi:hypothetical protein